MNLVFSQLAVSAVVVQTEGIQHLPIFYVSKTLLGAETRYLPLEKLALALMMASRKLSHYFHDHTIIVLTTFPLKALFERMNFFERILKWAVELGQYDIKFQPRTAIKAHALADFVAKFTPGSHHICPVDLTGTTAMGMKSIAVNTQPLIQDTQPHCESHRPEDKHEEADHATPGPKNSSTNKSLVQSESKGQT